jgi:hypothetical protein
MKRLTLLLARLYPRRWRERYGVEFHALLEEMGASPRAAVNVLSGALRMRIRIWSAGIIFAVGLALAVAGWLAGRHPHVTPGTGGVWHSDAVPGALLGFAVSLATVVLLLVSLALLVCFQFRPSLMSLRAAAICLIPYTALVIVVSLVTPRTIVSVGDSYCFDDWCIGVSKVNASARSGGVLYRADVRIFSDSSSTSVSARGASIYLLDERGRRFPLVRDASVPSFDSVVNPGESVRTSFTFAAASDSRELYLTGDGSGWIPPWVRLYLGSDTSLFHRRTLFRIL